MKIVAVTACPTGIAHTYIAKEKLIKAAKKLGHDIKIETQGAIGIENELSKKEIDEADAIILAIEMNISKMERFEGLDISKITVARAIKNPEKEIKEALNMEV
ncbi:MAG: PTS fructose transporter subunit IIB [Senegalia sp. (in: firmicutes)]|uniref:PTS fructose transporter subunit IIB n=1 Tax=Senegalia sp. (in: firmicutes) TaxID=1924098 RepID=UPI003F9B042C